MKVTGLQEIETVDSESVLVREYEDIFVRVKQWGALRVPMSRRMIWVDM
jgi:hypothetical protein